MPPDRIVESHGADPELPCCLLQVRSRRFLLLFNLLAQALFPLAQFRGEMDDYARQVRQLHPLPGYDAALLPGELEWRREREWAQEGVPVGRRHQEILHDIGAECGVPPPV